MLQKQWTTKSDFESGSLTNVIVPENLNELELKRLNLTGNGAWIFDAGKKANWQTFIKTDPDKNVFYRDDFRDNSLEAWVVVGGTWNCINEYMRGTSGGDWKINRVRVGPTTWTDLDILFKGYHTRCHRFFLRADHQGSNVNSYGLIMGPTLTGQFRVAGGEVLEQTTIYAGTPPKAWQWYRVQIYTSGGNVIGRLKWWTPGNDEPGTWQASHTWAGIWRGSGCFCFGRHDSEVGYLNYYDNILIKAKV